MIKAMIELKHWLQMRLIDPDVEVHFIFKTGPDAIRAREALREDCTGNINVTTSLGNRVRFKYRQEEVVELP